MNTNENIFTTSSTAQFNGVTINGANISSGKITNVGGYYDGSYVLDYTASTAGVYNVSLTLQTSQEAYLLIDVNGVNIDIDYYVPAFNTSAPYTFQIPLNEGLNVIVFHGDGSNYAPDILTEPTFNIDPKSSKNSVYKFSTAKFSNGAFFDSNTNSTENLGGIDDGSATLNVTVPSSGVYDLTIEYFEDNMDIPLLIDINDNYDGKIYILSSDEDVQVGFVNTVTFQIILQSNGNTLKFHGNGEDRVSGLKAIQLSQASTTSFSTLSTFSQTYSSNNFSLLGGAKKSSIPNFIENVGGANNGTATLITNVPADGEYSLSIEYLSTNDKSKFSLLINYNTNSVAYMPPLTNSLVPSDANTFIITTFLTSGRNRIMFLGDGVNSAPYLGNVTISQVTASVSQPYQITSITMGKGAGKFDDTTFIASIGGIKKGFAKLNIQTKTSGLYKLSFKYISPIVPRTFKLKVNKKYHKTVYRTQITEDWTSDKAKIFNLLLTLNAGSNVVKIEGNGTQEAPIIGEFNLTMADTNESITYDITNSKLQNSAKINNIGMISNIGGPKNGIATANVNVKNTGVYNLSFQYLATGSNEALLIDVNDLSTGKIYRFSHTLKWTLVNMPTFEIPVSLNSGNNTIKFRGLGSSYAPLIGNLNLISLPPKRPPLGPDNYYISSGTLANGAVYDASSGLVTSLGGPNDGSVTLTVNVKRQGEYLMVLEYQSIDDNTPLMFDINGISDNNIYIFTQTNFDINEEKEFKILLRQGANTIKFYGDKNDFGPDLETLNLIFLKPARF